MTAVADLTTVLTILKGSTPTNAQIAKVVALFKDAFPDNATNEQKARAVLDRWRNDIRAKLREAAEAAVYGPVLDQAHFPADQPALLQSVASQATAAGDAAAAEL